MAFGVVLCARPGIGAVTLALLFGLFNLIFGIWMLVQGIELRHTGKTLHPGTLPAQGKEPGLSHVGTRGTALETQKLPGPHGRRETAVVWRRDHAPAPGGRAAAADVLHLDHRTRGGTRRPLLMEVADAPRLRMSEDGQ